MQHRLFVYGTLQRGQRYHAAYLGERCGEAGRIHGWALQQGPGYPYAVRAQATVYGEVYRINTRLLYRLDRLENHPHEYRRRRCWVSLDSGRRCLAWLYVSQRSHPQARIRGGRWPSNRRNRK
jgi:gamma-glutamylaminecyclotransferase